MHLMSKQHIFYSDSAHVYSAHIPGQLRHASSLQTESLRVKLLKNCASFLLLALIEDRISKSSTRTAARRLDCSSAQQAPAGRPAVGRPTACLGSAGRPSPSRTGLSSQADAASASAGSASRVGKAGRGPHPSIPRGSDPGSAPSTAQKSKVCGLRLR